MAVGDGTAAFMASLSNVDKSVQELGQVWGARPESRRTFGSPARSQFLFALWSLEQELEETQAELNRRSIEEAWGFPAPDVTIAGLDDAREELAHLWAGELGKENEQFLRGLTAVKGKTYVQAPDQNAPGARQ